MLYEGTIIRASGLGGLYQVQTGSKGEVSCAKTLPAWEAYMDREYPTWHWSAEIDGLIQEQNGGRVFVWSVDGEHEQFGILWVEDEAHLESNGEDGLMLAVGEMVACVCFSDACHGSRPVVMVPKAAAALRPTEVFPCPSCGESDWSVAAY